MENKKDITEITKQITKLVDLQKTKEGLRDLFHQFLSESSYKVVPTKAVRTKNGQTVDESEYFTFMLLEQESRLERFKLEMNTHPDREMINRAMFQKMRVKTWPRAVLADLYQSFIKEEAEIALAVYRERLKCSQPSLKPLQSYLEIITGKPVYTEDLYAMAQSLWLVKRGLWHKTRKYHHMLCFMGDQGIGKSTAMDILFSPLKEFVAHTSLDSLSDSSAVYSLSTHLIQVCEELAGASRSDMNILKDIITNPRLARRMRYKALIGEFDNHATFFGSTNRPIGSILYDPTGMRRFYELRVDPSLKSRWDELNALDMVEVWQGIDEKLEDGYLAGKFAKYGALVLEAKEKNTRVDFKVQFFDDMNVIYTKGCRTRLVLNSVIKQCFKNYLMREGMDESSAKMTNPDSLAPILANMGFDKKATGRGRGWLLNDDCLIGQSEEEENRVRIVK